ncbi:hypothetical protein Pme01_38190 [Planosporangium mesophilum]|uniref:Uncharacterized protein n=1 Tax=Planosporangium mesophilum TaxID=689768 RepID=A0A8J3TFJ4_9ACTN|nr:hypothetical protein Pme01_38190 [Planosporangium mesophilum]
MAGAALGLAACTSNGTATPGASSSAGASGGPSTSASAGASTGASAGASATPGVANQCVVGKWRSTAVSMSFNAGVAQGQASGGEGVLLDVSPNGQLVADFGAAKPIIFSTTAAGTEIKGQFGYGGTLKGAVQVPASATPTGVWRPAGTSDWSAVTVTVEMISPVQGKIVDRAKLGDYKGAGDQTAGSVDVQPILREGTYECGSTTLKLGPPPGQNGVTWTMNRA